MKKSEFMELGVDEELALKLENASMEELKGYIPKARFDEVNNEKKKLETDISERDTQLEALKNSDVDISELKKQIETLQADNKAKDEAHNAEIKSLRLNNAIESALTSAKAKNITAVKSLLKDLDKAEIGEDGNVLGLSEQIEALKESDAYLFNVESTNPAATFKGVTPVNSDIGGRVDTSKMKYSELAKFMEANPDVVIN